MASRLSLASIALSGLMMTGCYTVSTLFNPKKKIFPEVTDQFLETREHVVGPKVVFTPVPYDPKMHDVSLAYHDTTTHEKWWINLHDRNKDGKFTLRDIRSYIHYNPENTKNTYALTHFMNNQQSCSVYSKANDNPIYNEKRNMALTGEGCEPLKSLFKTLNWSD
jgi:hypothetical protein